MVIVGLLSWWYSSGWRERFGIVRARLVRIYDYFSLDILIKTLFSPFRQIGTEQRAGGIGDQFRAFVDQLISRTIGACVRIVTVFVGGVILVMAVAAGLVEVIIWAFVPLLPVAGVILFAVGWVPSVEL